MHASNDDTTGSRHVRFEVLPTEQGAAYCPGNGDVIFLNDKMTEAGIFHTLAPVERMVMAARFRAWAEMAEAANEETDR